jgi:hypothetical protein
MPAAKPSPRAAEYLIEQAPNNGDGFGPHEDILMAETDCPKGCTVDDPHDLCPHGYESAGRTAGQL